MGGLRSGAWARKSDEGGVTSSEMIREVIPAGGNALGGQRGPGHSVADDWRTWEDMAGFRHNLPRRTVFGGESLSRGRGGRQTSQARGVCAPALELPRAWEGPHPARWRAEPRSEPDSGNPTVRDRRGALRNVIHGEPRNPLRHRKSGTGHSSPKDARTQFLSRQPHARFGGRGGREPFPTPIK